MPRRIMYEDAHQKVKAGKCPRCDGTGETSGYPSEMDDNPVLSRCSSCKGSGKPNEQDLKLSALMDKGLCPHCELPVKDGEDNYSTDECILHVARAIKALEIKVNTLIMAMTGNVQ